MAANGSGSPPIGSVYLWTLDAQKDCGGRVYKAFAPLERLTCDVAGDAGLQGQFVHVRNGASTNVLDEATGAIRSMPIGNARPDADGNYLFEPGMGGGRLDKVVVADPDFRWRYEQAAHFGEVNTYFHLDRIAAYVDELLHELGASSLPPVVAVVNAHHAATEVDGVRDGIPHRERWWPFQGGHYRLPSRTYLIDEWEALSPNGEIHLGPGRKLIFYGALVEATGGRYRANASHNAGILYHEYGHHITRHTADFRANAFRRPHRQNNKKPPIDEGTCDYWAASMLDTPHIWAWHRRHDEHEVHPRSLTSSMTMADYNANSRADAHFNGTIWGTALWDMRSRMRTTELDGARKADMLVLQALVLLGRLIDPQQELRTKSISRLRSRFGMGLSAILHADKRLFHDQHRDIIVSTFARRGIFTDEDVVWDSPAWQAASAAPRGEHPRMRPDTSRLSGVLQHVAADDIPASDDLLSGDALAAQIKERAEAPYSLIAVGDIMLGGRTTAAITQHGPDYPLDGLRPLLAQAPVVLGNLEGPFARKAHKMQRNYSYRVNPSLVRALTRAGINVLTLANNHLLDCGRAGVVETLDVLAQANVAALGAGMNTQAAHAPVIRDAGRLRIGMLGYYWNSRCAARDNLPGSAMDTPEALASDIRRLRELVDRIVVTFHWGIPYEREPLPEDRAKARLAVDCGADVVIGHHPHVTQPFEVYRGCPIIYSVGNMAFGSGNSKAEGLLVGVRFAEQHTQVAMYPLYVKNRDPRVSYQPKALTGRAAERILRRMIELSGSSGAHLRIEAGRGLLDLPWPKSAQ